MRRLEVMAKRKHKKEACLWGYARDKGYRTKPQNPTRKEKGGITIKKFQE